MTYEEWKATRQYCPDLGAELDDTFTGSPGYLYDAGFIVADMICFTVHLGVEERMYASLDDAEWFLWDNWCSTEANA